MHELTNLDLVIIVLYMIGMLFVGVWFVNESRIQAITTLQAEPWAPLC